MDCNVLLDAIGMVDDIFLTEENVPVIRPARRISVLIAAIVAVLAMMVTALAAIGLGPSITDFKKAGLAPMFYGITIDTLVTLTALAVIWCMGFM